MTWKVGHYNQLISELAGFVGMSFCPGISGSKTDRVKCLSRVIMHQWLEERHHDMFVSWRNAGTHTRQGTDIYGRTERRRLFLPFVMPEETWSRSFGLRLSCSWPTCCPSIIFTMSIRSMFLKAMQRLSTTAGDSEHIKAIKRPLIILVYSGLLLLCVKSYFCINSA